MESWQGFWCYILMKLSQKLLKYDPYHMTPPSGSSGTSTSSKTLGRDLEDRWSLDRVCDVGSWWNLQKLLKYDPYHMPPPRGSSGTSTSSKTPGGDLEDRWSLDRVSAFSKFFRNLLILKDSRERLWGQVESWRVSDVGYWWNFHRNFLRIIPIIWHQLLVHQESLQVHQEFLSLPRLQVETWRTGGVLTGFLMLDLDETFTEASEVLSLSYDTTSRFIRNLHILQDSRKRLGGQVESWQGFWCWVPIDSTFRFIRNLHFLQDSRKKLGGQMEFWWVSDVGSRWKSHMKSSLGTYWTCMSF